MGLMKKFFGKGDAEPRTNGSTQFAESDSSLPDEAATKSRNSTRRDLVRVVLSETMRRHGVPSDWIDCRALSVTHEQKSGMHVQLLVRKADQQLLPYVHAFQESFREQVLKADPTARDWLLSVGWEFYEKPVRGFSPMPDTTSWAKSSETDAMSGDTQPPEETEEDLASDLQRLHSLMSAPAELTNELPQAEPRTHKPVA